MHPHSCIHSSTPLPSPPIEVAHSWGESDKVGVHEGMSLSPSLFIDVAKFRKKKRKDFYGTPCWIPVMGATLPLSMRFFHFFYGT